MNVPRFGLPSEKYFSSAAISGQNIATPSLIYDTCHGMAADSISSTDNLMRHSLILSQSGNTTKPCQTYLNRHQQPRSKLTMRTCDVLLITIPIDFNTTDETILRNVSINK